MAPELGVEREGARGDLDRHRRAGAVAADQQGAEDQNKKGDPGIDDKGGEMPVQPDQLLDNAAAQRLDQSAKKQRQASEPAAREIAVHEIVPEQYLVIRFGMPGRLPSADAPAD